jgi:hypothetical protein
VVRPLQANEGDRAPGPPLDLLGLARWPPPAFEEAAATPKGGGHLFFFLFFLKKKKKFIYLFFKKFIIFLLRWTRVAILLVWCGADVAFNRIC